MMRHSIPTAALLITIAAATLHADDRKVMFGDMDYGPVLAYTVQAEWPEHNGNIATKGLAIKLDGGKAGVLFDMDLMRVAAAWVNDSDEPYLDLSRTNLTSYKGDALAFGRGERVFGTKVTPGWVVGEKAKFDDPRKPPYGVLPEGEARFKGYYLHGNRVVLSYAIGDVGVLEMHDVLEHDGVLFFKRTFEVEPTEKPLSLLVFNEPGAVGEMPTFHLIHNTARMRGESLRLTSKRGEREVIVQVGVLGDGPGIKFARPAFTDGEVERVGENEFRGKLGKGRYDRVAVEIDASKERRRFTVVVSQSAGEHEGFLPGALNSHDNFDLYTRGGPERWPRVITTNGSRGDDGGPYTLDHITCPEKNPYHAWMRPTAFDFFECGTKAAVSTWNGDVWIVEGIDDDLDELKWKRFATGLHEPLGVVVKDGDVFTIGRDQVTRLHDLNNDGEADYYESFNNDGIAWPRTMAMELHRDAEGNLYYIKNGNRVPGNIPLQGCVFKVSPDGTKQAVFATGFRSANGMSVSPQGVVTVADQEGNWVPTTRLDIVRPGRFYGYRPHAHGMVPAKPANDPADDYEQPLCWIPKSQDNSAGGQAWVLDDRWGPFAGRMLHTSYGKAKLFLVSYEPIDAPGRSPRLHEQGGIIPFPFKFDTGIMRARFNPRDGQLYLLGMRGWQTDGTIDSGFYRVRYTGKPVNMPSEIRVKPNGVELTFTDPMDKASAGDAQNYAAEMWNYVYSEKYGSDEFSVINPRRKGHDPVEIESAQVSADGKKVLLVMPELEPVMQMKIQMNLKAADGSAVRYELFNTIHHVP